MGIGNQIGCRAIFGLPLLGPGRTLGKFPVVLKQIIWVLSVPASWVRGPRAFDTVGDRVRTVAGSGRVLPAQTLSLERFALWCRTHMTGCHRAVALAKGVTAGDQGDCFFVDSSAQLPVKTIRSAHTRLDCIEMTRVSNYVGEPRQCRVVMGSQHLPRPSGRRTLCRTSLVSLCRGG